ncbi:hypothetical protein NVT87_06375 [Acinetobacter radioresistens]|jgi:hypothetical protein|uniref:Transcriptional regulator SutA RNAP-binding domain-containing protein n=2 Tax=Acinetobacter radioresistens TaxID=40216 RepID=A0A3D3G368_ACIRA|nr:MULTISPECIES: hypothetical protein [Acinetobacter]EET81826.1 hypothetical protein ACIRA0001_0695 [Acinetobacter radioresistens SK82]EEY86690.1 hypothetical protein HMPREF0018_01263 [Acinetobacter radioresistens SH164]EJO35206.1 hypothetical protein ACINWCA157_0392 [Acinetobacter radioresistens WC-A-157]ENV85273.1 hypothetical protein F940_02408 [Acinetobacter radioresistens NIPH 2130]EXB81634.1 hypothetical protein J538_2656 [Acinetobacter sp. 272263]
MGSEKTDMNDYDDVEDVAVDEDEAKAAEKGAVDEEAVLNDTDLAEAETLTVTAKQKKRQALEDEIARFLASGGKITEVPPDEGVRS